jgi:hypothetical protein
MNPDHPNPNSTYKIFSNINDAMRKIYDEIKTKKIISKTKMKKQDGGGGLYDIFSYYMDMIIKRRNEIDCNCEELLKDMKESKDSDVLQKILEENHQKTTQDAQEKEEEKEETDSTDEPKPTDNSLYANFSQFMNKLTKQDEKKETEEKEKEEQFSQEPTPAPTPACFSFCRCCGTHTARFMS